jgi:hypothetical protein
MPDPVSWRMIKPGWKVEAADGSEVGEVDEITGDDNADIFDGLAFSTSALGHPRYVPSENVAEIVDGAVRLSLSPDEVEKLGEYELPPTSLEVEPDSSSGVIAGAEAEARKVVGDVVQPVRPTPERVGILDRLRFWFLRKRS